MKFAAEDLTSFLDFAKDSVGRLSGTEIERGFDRACQDLGPIAIGAAARASRLSLEMSERVLKMHMRDEGGNQSEAIAERLSKSFLHHGYPISHSEACALGLKVVDRDTELEQLLWRTWRTIEEGLELRRRFDPMQGLRFRYTMTGKE